jgi:hypothetical protein
MFTEYGEIYGIFMILVLLGGGVDLFNSLRVVIFRKDMLSEYSKTVIKWIKIAACLAFGGYMAYFAYQAGSGFIVMSQLMFTLHLTAAIIMLTDFCLSLFLKLKFGSKKQS